MRTGSRGEYLGRDGNGKWKRLYIEELHSLYHQPIIVRVAKSKRIRSAGHVARMEEGSIVLKMLTGTPQEREH